MTLNGVMAATLCSSAELANFGANYVKQLKIYMLAVSAIIM